MYEEEHLAGGYSSNQNQRRKAQHLNVNENSSDESESKSQISGQKSQKSHQSSNMGLNLDQYVEAQSNHDSHQQSQQPSQIIKAEQHVVEQTIGDFLLALAEDLGIQNETQKQQILELENKFSENFYYNTSQLSMLTDQEWENLKDFVPQSLLGSMYSLLHNLNEEGADQVDAQSHGFSQFTALQSTQRNTVVNSKGQRMSVKLAKLRFSHANTQNLKGIQENDPNEYEKSESGSGEGMQLDTNPDGSKVIQIHFDKRVFPLKIFKDVTKADLEEQVRGLIKAKPNKVVHYMDDDGNHIMMSGLLPNNSSVWVNYYNPGKTIMIDSDDNEAQEEIGTHYWSVRGPGQGEIDNDDDNESVYKVKGWTGCPLPRDQWYQNWTCTPKLPNDGKLMIDIKLLAISYPFPGYFGLIGVNQEKPDKAYFDSSEYPYLLHTLSMDHNAETEGDMNPRMKKKKMNNCLKIRVQFDYGFKYEGNANVLTRQVKFIYLNKDETKFEHHVFKDIPKNMLLYINTGIFPNVVSMNKQALSRLSTKKSVKHDTHISDNDNDDSDS